MPTVERDISIGEVGDVSIGGLQKNGAWGKFWKITVNIAWVASIRALSKGRRLVLGFVADLQDCTNMAAVREYFETDFSYALRVHTRLPSDDFNIEIVILYDFSGYKNFFACYDSDGDHAVQYYIDFLSTFKPGETELQLSGKVVLPSGRDFPGRLQVNNVKGPFVVLAKFHTDPNWISSNDLHTSVPVRIFIYSESDLSEDDVIALKTQALALGYEVQYRSKRHALERSKFETPVGFISYEFQR